jgi:RimJ/RimL family protein N-acetyltransferase
MAMTVLSELHSPRLILRRLTRDDLAAFCAYRSLPDVARFQSWDTFGPEDGAALLEEQACREPNIPGTWLQLALTLKESGEMIGDCGMHFPQNNPRNLEVGITLAPSHWRRGYASEALSTVIDFAFTVLDKHRITAVTDAENAAAAALFHRLGFRREGHFIENVWFKGKWGSEFAFALLRSEWEHRQIPASSSDSGGPFRSASGGGSWKTPILRYFS